MAKPFNIKVTDRDRGWRALFAAVEAAKGERYAKVGVLADSEKGGFHVPGAKLTVAEIAVVQEFGTEDGKVPSRSFIRSTFDKLREEISHKTAQLLTQILFGKVTQDGALNILGSWFAAEIKKAITTGPGIPPPDAPATARAKASKGKTGHIMQKGAKTIGDALAQIGAVAAVRTLVDTSRMLNAVTWALISGALRE